MLYIPRYREEEHFVIVSKEDGLMDFYTKQALPLLEQGKYDAIEPYKMFDLDNILALKRSGKLSRFFDDQYLNDPKPLKAPISISIEITRSCNLNCKHCSVKAGTSRDNELSFEEIIDVIDQVKHLEAFSLFISGGEPFSHPRILDILDYIARNDIDCFVQTNGLLLTPEIISKIPKSIYIVMSFDGLEHCNQLHASNRDLSYYDTTFDLLRKNGLNFTVQFVAYKDNLDDLPKTYDYCIQKKIDMAALDLFCVGRANLNRDIFPSKNDWESMEKLADKKYAYEKKQQEFEREIFINSPNPYHFAFIQKLQEIFERTYSGVFACYVAADGVVYPDVMHAGEGLFPGGNIREKSLADIWNHSFLDVRELVKWSKWEKCKTCPLNSEFCDYRMPVLSYNIHKNYTVCGALESQIEIMNKRYEKREKDTKSFSNDRARELDFW